MIDLRPLLALKTVLRSPIRSVLTFVLLTAVTFAFFSRVAEYAITAREMRAATRQYRGVAAAEENPAVYNWVNSAYYTHTDPRIEGMYQLGEYAPQIIRYQPVTKEHIGAISGLPYISSVSERYMTAGVSDTYMRIKERRGSMADFWGPMFYSGWFVIEGTLTDVAITVEDYTQHGRPEYNHKKSLLTIGDTVFLSEIPSSYLAIPENFIIENLYHEQASSDDDTLWSRMDMVWYNLGEGGNIYVNTSDHICAPEYVDNLAVGNRYVFVLQDMWMNSRQLEDTYFGGYVLLGGFLTNIWCEPIQPVGGEPENYMETEKFKPLRELIEIINSDLHTFDVVYTDDMGAILRFAEGDMAVADGRALTTDDSDNGARVCVISRELANEYGLSVGDTLTLKLGAELFEQFLHIGARAMTRERYSAPADAVTLEIVGIYSDTDGYRNQAARPNWSYSINTVFVPKSLLAVEGSKLDGHEFSPSEISFTIDNAWDIEAFIEDVAPMFSEMGMTLYFSDSGWPDIADAFRESGRLSIINIAVFALAVAAATWLAVFLFIGRKRQEYAIMRALGTTRKASAQTLAIPLMSVVLASIVAGSCAACVYVAGTAAGNNAFLALQGHTVNTTIPAWAVAGCVTAQILLTLLITFAILRSISSLPPLMLLAGAGAPRKKTNAEMGNEGSETGRVDTNGGVKAADMPPAYRTMPAHIETNARGAVHIPEKGHFCRFIIRYVCRHIRRNIVKSISTGLLAALLLGAFGQFAVMKKAYADLFSGMVITADFVGGIQLQAMHMIVRNSFVAERYYATSDMIGLDYEWAELVATNNVARYIGEEASIAFIDGYDATCFDQAGDIAVVSKSHMDEYGLTPGDSVDVIDFWNFSRYIKARDVYIYERGGGPGVDSEMLEAEFQRGIGDLRLSPHAYRIVGVISELPARYDGAVFTPGSHDAEWRLDIAEVTLADNNRVDEFREWGKSIVNPTASLDFVLDTSKLENIRNTLRLLEALYPGVLAATLLIGGALCCLAVLRSSKEAAIMRVLGTTKRKTRSILVLERVLLNIAGLAAGTLALFVYNGRVLAEIVGPLYLFTGMYLAAVLAAAAVCSALATHRSALEMLQTKE